MVFSKEWFKKHNKTLCWFANAPIIKYWFRWLLRIHKDIPWNEKIEEIMPNAFTYGKKLVLVDCVKLKNGEEVFNHSKKLHRKLKNKGLLVKRLRYQQTTDFRTHEKFGKRLYYGLKPLWYLLHFWDWSTSIQPALNCGFDTLTVYPDAGTGNTTVDGMVGRSSGLSQWSYLRDSDGTEYDSTTTATDGVRITQGNSYDYWTGIKRSIFTLDTSLLTSSATISNSIFTIRCIGKTNSLNADMAIDIFTSSPNANNALQNSDYGQIGTISQTGSPISYASIQTGAYNDLTFNATGIGNISKTGITKLGLREANYDAKNIEPTPGSPNSYFSIMFYYADQSGTTYDPKLVVTYSLPVVAPTVTTQSATNIAQTSCTGNGNITATGGANATRRGFCYKIGTTGDPTTSDNVAYDDGSFGTGAFTKSITGLTPGTSYRVRAYAINSAGTSYGTTVDVTTLSSFIPRTTWF